MNCADIPETAVASLTAYIDAVQAVAQEWSPVFPWFRGEPGSIPTPLTARVFRPPRSGFHFDENNLLQSFRRRAHLMGLPIIPQRGETDQWIFLARHVGLPTRLLDWTEGALIGLYFALLEENPRVWMLNPHHLNLKSAPDALPNVFGLTWFTPRANCHCRDDETKADEKPDAVQGGERSRVVVNIASRNIGAAWTQGAGEMEFPVAIEPTTIHPRMNAQHSYFTVQGSYHGPMCEQVGPDCLRRFAIRVDDPHDVISQLRMMGIADSTIMPDAEALTTELARFMVVPD